MFGDGAALVGAEALADGTFIERLLEVLLGDVSSWVARLLPAQMARTVVDNDAVGRFRRATARILVFVEQRHLQVNAIEPN
jgi:hypothetical protein